MSRRPGTPVLLAVAVAGVLLLLVTGLIFRPSTEPQPALRPATDSTSEALPSPAPAPADDPGGELLVVAGAAAANPVEVRVPSVGISSSLDRLAVLPDGTLAPPPRWQVAGWYDGGPRPGEIGPAVIAGHVDSPGGPAVFAELSALSAGDLVEVEGADGSTTTFRVDRLDDAPKNAFPTEAVYGQTPDPQLRLITCSGAFDRSVGHYEDNLIVFATKVAS